MIFVQEKAGQGVSSDAKAFGKTFLVVSRQ